MSNNDLQEREYILSLLDSYKNLLTEKQRNIILAHYEYDLSFSEISENEQISRAAVGDTINKALAKLEEYEQALGLVKLKKHIDNTLDENKQNCTDLQKLAVYEKLLEEIKDGI